MSRCLPSAVFTGRDSSLNIRVLFFVSSDAYLSQVDVYVNVLGLSVVNIYHAVNELEESQKNADAKPSQTYHTP